jgi:hypothetical protein
MPDNEWVSLYDAVNRLEILWGITRSIAEEILRNAIKSGKVEVRGKSVYSIIPEIITDVGSIFFPRNSLLSAYENIEIDWNGLLVTARKLVPSWINVVEAPIRKPHGPTPGTVNRYGEADKKLFPEMKRLIRDKKISANAAALALAELGKVPGSGTSQSRARRLANRFLCARK